MKKLSIFVILFVIILLILGFFLTREKRPENKKIISGKIDEYGCSQAAGYSFDKEIGSCLRSWEVKEINKIEAAKIAVKLVGSSYGLTISSIGQIENCPRCFIVHLQKASDKIVIEIQNGEVKDIRNEAS